MDALISVIVPVYKVETLLERCVDSILSQTYPNLEVILVDDGSPDRCGEICDAYAGKDSRVRVLHKPNGGLSSARNAGIEVARGEYLAFADSDDWVEPDAYRQMLELAAAQKIKLICAGRYDVNEADGRKIRGLCPEKTEVISAEEMLRRLFVWDHCDSASWDKLYHRSLFEDIRYPLGVYYEDIPTTYRLVERAGQVGMLAVPVYNYYHRAGSITVSALSSRTFQLEAHTAAIYSCIRDRYPEMEKEVRYFHVCSLVYSVISVDQADKEASAPYLDRAEKSRKELRRNLGFLLTAPMFGIQERLTDLLLALKLYKPLRSFYHLFR